MTFWRSFKTCILAATLLVAAIVGTQPTQGASERRVALIIGNDAYTHLPALNNARKDAEDMAVKLRELGFETILKVNAGRRGMHRALGQFEARLNDGVIGLAFFAGHGIQSDGQNYLIPADANIEVEDDLRAEALTAQDVLAAMERAGNPLNIVILDACRDNPLPKRTRSARRGLTVVGIPAGAKGTAILYSAGEGQRAEDGPRGSNGVFTGELLQVLDEPGLSLEQVFKRVNRQVQERTAKRQRPWSLVSLSGDFVFRAKAPEIAPPSVVQPTVPPTTDMSATIGVERDFWKSIEGLNSKAGYDAYLQAYPNGKFALVAHLKLAMLTPPETPEQEPPEIEELDSTYVALKTANLRAAPTTRSKKIGNLLQDQGVNVTGRLKDGRWLRVAHAGGQAFLFADLAREVDGSELRDWDALGTEPGRAVLEAFLAHHPLGHFAPRARIALAALVNTEAEAKARAVERATRQAAAAKAKTQATERAARQAAAAESKAQAAEEATRKAAEASQMVVALATKPTPALSAKLTPALAPFDANHHGGIGFVDVKSATQVLEKEWTRFRDAFLRIYFRSAYAYDEYNLGGWGGNLIYPDRIDRISSRVVLGVDSSNQVMDVKVTYDTSGQEFSYLGKELTVTFNVAKNGDVVASHVTRFGPLKTSSANLSHKSPSETPVSPSETPIVPFDKSACDEDSHFC
jgi:uncharacterized caspase-like protein